MPCRCASRNASRSAFVQEIQPAKTWMSHCPQRPGVYRHILRFLHLPERDAVVVTADDDLGRVGRVPRLVSPPRASDHVGPACRRRSAGLLPRQLVERVKPHRRVELMREAGSVRAELWQGEELIGRRRTSASRRSSETRSQCRRRVLQHQTVTRILMRDTDAFPSICRQATKARHRCARPLAFDDATGTVPDQTNHPYSGGESPAVRTFWYSVTPSQTKTGVTNGRSWDGIDPLPSDQLVAGWR